MLGAARTLGDGGAPLVFSTAQGKPLTDMALSRPLTALKIAAVPHGLRATFRDWAAAQTNTLREVVEAALAHVVRDKVEVAYARSDLVERRRRLMDDWSAIWRMGAGRRRRAETLAERPPEERRLRIGRRVKPALRGSS